MKEKESFYLSELSTFGRVSAEKESENLIKYFIQTPTYINAKRGETRKTYYVGHRGSGKSALFQYLMYETEKLNNNIIVSLTPDEFSYEIFSRVEHECYDMKSVYSVVWRYTLLTSMFRKIIEHVLQNKISRRTQEEINTIKEYLINNNILNEDINNTFFDYFTKFNISWKNIKISGINIINPNKKEDKKLVKMLNMQDIQPAISAFRRLLNTYNIYLFIDELDTGWDNSNEAKNFLHGLFSAINRLKDDKGMFIYLSLRQDMYNNLPSIFNDTEKIRDEIEELYWNKESLMALIGRRLLNFLPNYNCNDITPTSAIELVFEDGILSYIIDHTLYRPREVITFCNSALNIYKKSLFESDIGGGQITKKIVEMVENNFSNNRMNEIAQEYCHQYPKIKFIFFSFESMNVLYNFENFTDILSEAIINSSDKYGNDFWVVKYLDCTEKLVKILFEIGFIKIYSDHPGSYLAYYEVPFHSMRNIDRIQIHPIFHSVLKLFDNTQIFNKNLTQQDASF